ncbi:MAG: hypothetical protein QXY49_03320 [Thermofilaceae archaeon]
MEEEITVEVTLTWRVLTALAALAAAAAIITQYQQLNLTVKELSASLSTPIFRETAAEVSLDKQSYKPGDPVRLRICLSTKIEKILTVTIEEPSGLAHLILAKPEDTCLLATVTLPGNASPGEYKITVRGDGKLIAIKMFKVSE